MPYYEPDYSYYPPTYPSAEVEVPAVTVSPAALTATVQVRLPDPQAMVWFDGQYMESAGTVRNFKTPSLEMGQDYTYTVQAVWTQDGRQVTQQQTIQVRAGSTTVVYFPNPADTGSLPAVVPAP